MVYLENLCGFLNRPWKIQFLPRSGWVARNLSSNSLTAE